MKAQYSIRGGLDLNSWATCRAYFMCSSWEFVPEVIVMRHQKVDELGWGHVIQYVPLPHLKPQWLIYISTHSNVSYSWKFHYHLHILYSIPKIMVLLLQITFLSFLSIIWIYYGNLFWRVPEYMSINTSKL